jgi:hypothetical protein
MTLHTALSDGFDRLYHWQRFDADRLRQSLQDRTIYCSDPATFNDPWDCKPHFNSEILQDPTENEQHVQWAIKISRRYIPGITGDLSQWARACALILRFTRNKSMSCRGNWRPARFHPGIAFIALVRMPAIC